MVRLRKFFLIFNTHLTFNNSVSGLQLCTKCKKGHLYPVVTASASPEPKRQFKETGTIRDYECAICGYKQKAAKQIQNTHIINKNYIVPIMCAVMCAKWVGDAFGRYALHFLDLYFFYLLS